MKPRYIIKEKTKINNITAAIKLLKKEGTNTLNDVIGRLLFYLIQEGKIKSKLLLSKAFAKLSKPPLLNQAQKYALQKIILILFNIIYNILNMIYIFLEIMESQ